SLRCAYPKGVMRVVDSSWQLHSRGDDAVDNDERRRDALDWKFDAMACPVIVPDDVLVLLHAATPTTMVVSTSGRTRCSEKGIIPRAVFPPIRAHHHGPGPTS